MGFNKRVEQLMLRDGREGGLVIMAAKYTSLSLQQSMKFYDGFERIVLIKRNLLDLVLILLQHWKQDYQYAAICIWPIIQQ